MSVIRTRWAAIGAAVAVTLGAGGIGFVSATNPDDAVAFVPITPCRVMDTRAEFNVGPKTTPIGPGEIHTVNTTTGDTGNCSGIPTTATGVSLNITALDATLPTFLTVWATGDAQPEASSLNPVPGQPPTPNAVTTGIDTNGRFDIYNLHGNVEVIADISGYYQDHHHDDRYQPGKIIPIDLRSMFLRGNAAHTQGGNIYAGVRLPITGTPEFDFTFRLPDNYVSGDTVTTELWWHTNEADCRADISWYYNSVGRPGMVNQSFSLNELLIFEPLSNPANVVRPMKWQLDQPTGTTFQPGDAIWLDFFRTSDECSGDVIIDHIFVEYG